MCLFNFLEMKVARWLGHTSWSFLILLLTPCVSLLSEDLNFAVGRIDWNQDQTRLDPTLSFPTCDLEGDNGRCLLLGEISKRHAWMCVCLAIWDMTVFSFLTWIAQMVPQCPRSHSKIFSQGGDCRDRLMCSLFRSYLYLIHPLSCLYLPTPK